MKSKVIFSKEELTAIKIIAGIECGNISCAGCPLSLSNLSNRHSMLTPNHGCFRNIAVTLVCEQEEENNEK